MTDTQRKIIRQILEVLHDGPLQVEWWLYGAVASRVQPAPTLSDFSDALKEAEKRNLIIGITDKMDERKWAISEAGEVLRRTA